MAKHWIKQAVQHPGALHRDLHVPQGEKIPEAKLEAAKHSDNPTVASRANLAATLMGMHHDRASKMYGKKRVRAG